MQYRLSAVLMVVMLCPFWGYGGTKKQGGALKSSGPSLSMYQGINRSVVSEQAEIAALDESSHPRWAGDDRRQAQSLLLRLKERRIAIKPTFYKLLGRAAPAQRSQLVSRCLAFFDSVDTQEIPNTSCLTSMIQKKTHIVSFLSHSDDAVRRIARTPALRSLSSLFNKRGFPQATEDTQAFMEWEVWWRGEGDARTLDRELLRAFSSMFNGKGLPDKKAVDDYLQMDIWWQGEGRTRTLDHELLHAVSSMFNGRGLPDKKSVEDYLQRDVWWQGEGRARTLDRELLHAFSSMFNGKGLPDKKSVDDYLQWEFWRQGEGNGHTLDRELLRVFSSMFGGKGLPDKESVADYLQQDIWWQGKGDGRTLDRELLRVVSSMCHGKGLPDKKAMDNYLSWEIWWQRAGKVPTLDRELMHVFSSMCHGKGFPDSKVLDNYLKWEIWWQKRGNVRTLDRNLLRVFSSMFHGRGLPDKRWIDNYLLLDVWWREEGGARILDRALLCAFSGMFAGKGLPDRKSVEDYLQLAVWWQSDGETRTLDRELLRAFSLMFHGRGLPDKKVVEDYLKWEIWWREDGQTRTLDRDLLRAFSVVLNGKGLPDKRGTGEILQWLAWEGQWNRSVTKVMARLYSGAYAGHKALGLPDINKLRKAEQQLMGLIPLEEWEQDQENDIVPLIKVVALYLANDGGTRQLSWTDCVAWLREYPDPVPKRFLLRQLLFALRYHGGRGIKGAVALICGKPDAAKRFVFDALGRGHALASVQYTLQEIKPTDWRQYLFTKELDPLSSQQPWAISPLVSPKPPAPWLETLLRQSVLGETDIDQLYNYRDQLTRDHVVDILLRMDSSVSQETVQRWQLLLSKEHYQTLTVDGSDEITEVLYDAEDILRDLFPDALL